MDEELGWESQREKRGNVRERNAHVVRSLFLLSPSENPKGLRETR